MTLAGKDDVAKAWGVYVKPTDRVAVKFNGLFVRATTHPEVIAAVTNGLVKAGVDPAKTIQTTRWLEKRLGRELPSAVARAGWWDPVASSK